MSASITTVFTNDCNVAFSNKKGDALSISAEGAVFKGGAALSALKDSAMISAMNKAQVGRYVAAADIIEVSFPAVGKAVRALAGLPSFNKANFMTLLGGVERTTEPTKGWSKKQSAARQFVKNLRTIPALGLNVADDENTIDV